MTLWIVRLVQIISDILILAVIVDVAVSYFLTPWHPVRRALDQIVVPLLKPIQKFMPLVGNIDFSPVVLILLIQLVQFILIQIVRLAG